MASSLRLANPLCWLQVRLLGGWQRILLFSALYLAALTVTWVSMRRLMPDDPIGMIVPRAIMGLGAIQLGLLLLGGCTAVSRAMSRDMRTRMIESHRLSPLSTMEIVVGYLIGPNLLVLIVYALGLLFGTIMCEMGSLSPREWLKGGALALLVAVQLWSMVIYFGVVLQKPGNPGGAIAGLVAFSQMWVAFVPGAGLALGAYVVINIYLMMTNRSHAGDKAMGIMIISSVIMLSVWLTGAARKYRRPDLPAFDPFRSIAFVAIWLIISLVAMRHYEELAAFGFGRRAHLGFIHFLVTLLLSLLFGLVPLRCAADFQIRTVRGGEYSSWSERLPGLAIALILVAMICGILSQLQVYDWSAQVPVLDVRLIGPAARFWWPTALAMLLALAAVDGLQRRWLIARPKSASTAAGLFVVLFWVLPTTADYLWARWKEEMSVSTMDGLPFTSLFGVSPLGTIIAVWSEFPISLWPGLVFQAVVAVALQIFGRRAVRSERRRRSALIESEMRPS